MSVRKSICRIRICRSFEKDLRMSAIQADEKVAFKTETSVRVRSAEEILATLDSDGTVDGLLSFMPEMLQFARREFRLQSSAHKTCDGVGVAVQEHGQDRPSGRDLGGDGSAHDGCQANCPLFFKTEWLSPASEPAPVSTPVTDAAALEMLTNSHTPCGQFRRNALSVPKPPMFGRPRGRCLQSDPRQYIPRTSRAVTLVCPVSVRGVLVFAFKKYQQLSRPVLPRRLWIHNGEPYPFYQGTGTGERTPALQVFARPGCRNPHQRGDHADLGAGQSKPEDVVRIRRSCLTAGKARSSVNRVASVEIIDEQSGKMIRLGDCSCSRQRRLPRPSFTDSLPGPLIRYWRSSWLRHRGNTSPALPGVIQRKPDR